MSKAAKEYIDTKIDIIKISMDSVKYEMNVCERMDHYHQKNHLTDVLKQYEKQLSELQHILELLDEPKQGIFQNIMESYEKKLHPLDINVYLGDCLVLQCTGTVDAEYLPVKKMLDIHIEPAQEKKCC